MTDPDQPSLFDLDDLTGDVEVEPISPEPKTPPSTTRSWSQVMDFCEDLAYDTGSLGEPYLGLEGSPGYTPDGGLIPIQGSWSGVQGVAFTRGSDSFTAVPVGPTGEPMVDESEIAQEYTFGVTPRGRIIKSDIARFGEMFKKVSAPQFGMDRRQYPDR